MDYALPKNDRITALMREIESLREEIKHVYGLTEDRLIPNRDMRLRLGIELQQEMSDVWPAKRREYVGHANPDEETIAKIDTIAEYAAKEYVATFYLRSILNRQTATTNQPQHYDLETTRLTLGHLYSNHLCNLIEEMLQQTGIDEITAHRLNGSIIHRAITAYVSTTSDIHSPQVRPAQTKTDDPIILNQQIATLRGYGSRLKARLEKEAKWHGKYEYPPEPSPRMEALERAMHDIRTKLKRVYDLTDEQLKPTEVDNSVLDQHVRHAVGGRDWKDNRRYHMEENDLAPGMGRSLDAMAADFTKRYTEALYIRHYVKTVASVNPRYSAPHKTRHYQDPVTDVYLNHLCNLAEATQQKMGVDPIAAHRFNGSIIARSIAVFEMAFGLDANSQIIYPVQRPSRAPEHASAEIAELQHYWRDRVTELHELHTRQSLRPSNDTSLS